MNGQAGRGPGGAAGQGASGAPRAPLADRLFDRLAGRGGGQHAGPPGEGANGLRQAAALTLIKLADGLIDPKLVLAWLLNALGAPAGLVALLVPIREAGALLPQLLIAPQLGRLRRRKWAWVLGSAVQGAAAGAIALAALALSGAAAGAAVCAALAVLAVARAAASVSIKDVLGKTVARRRRGAVTGLAGSASAAGVLVFAGLLVAGLLESRAAVIAGIALAAALWLAAAWLMAGLDEAPSRVAAGPRTPRWPDLSPLRRDAQLRRFILVRGLLVSTALAPPYMVLLVSGAGLAALDRLGALLLASAAASLLGSYLWGRLADRSSRRVLQAAGLMGAAAMGAAVLLAAAGLAQTLFAMPAALFVLMLAYHGVRQGRSTYLVDMAPANARSTYAALANTAIGAILLAAGALGGAGAALGPEAALAGFAAMSLAAAAAAQSLQEVEAAPA